MRAVARGDGAVRLTRRGATRISMMRATLHATIGAAVVATLLTAPLLAQAASMSSAATQRDSATMERGRRYSEWLLGARTDRLWPLFAPDMRTVVRDSAGLATFASQLGAQLGARTTVLGERVDRVAADAGRYAQRARFAKAPQVILLEWTLDAAGMVHGLLVRPEPATAPTTRLDYVTRTPLRLPFDGAWLVVWGGREIVDNYHAATVGQRFAYDFLVADSAGRTHRGDGRRNEDYLCWDRAILAPADGRVVVAVDGLPDNVPGAMDPAHAAGNHVVIAHADGEHSLLAHLRPGSLGVAVGDSVRAGQPLGRCGNSGNSSEPHLHYHLQTGAALGIGEGLPAQFRQYRADGAAVDRGEPRRGQRVEARGGGSARR